jgi:hypothetical protein
MDAVSFRATANHLSLSTHLPIHRKLITFS